MIKTLFAIIGSFGKIGLISLGGGNSMLKLIEYEAVTSRHWLAPEEFISMVSTTFLFPGLTAVKLSALIGYKAAGLAGLMLAVICINLPGLLLTVLGYHLLVSYNNPALAKIMIAVQYGALALLAAASYSVAQGVISSYYSLSLVVITIIFFLGLVYFNLSPFWGFITFIGLCFFIVL